MKYTMSAGKELTPDMIEAYIKDWALQAERLEKLYDYYIGKHSITERSVIDVNKPNNRVVNPYPSYIVDIFTGYFMGEPVAYNSDDKALLERLNDIFNYNDEAAENAELAKDAGIYGQAAEQIYLDADTNIRMKKMDARSIIPIFDDTPEEEMLYVIRPYIVTNILSSSPQYYAEVYGREWKRIYDRNNGIRIIEEQPHSFGLVPIVIYQNNEEELGDFEPVLSLIDAYDKAQSDSINDLEYFADAYLMLTGLNGTDGDDISQMKKNRVIMLPDSDARAEWLVKNINDTYVENLKIRLDQNIHKFSKCPAMTDEDFASNASGVAMKYKLMGLETATSKKERAFKKGLQRRIELIVNMLNVLGGNYDYRSVDMIFTRNIPANLSEMADVMTKIGHLLSEETQIKLLPIDVDVNEEAERKEAEKEKGLEFVINAPQGGEIDEEVLAE